MSALPYVVCVRVLDLHTYFFPRTCIPYKMEVPKISPLPTRVDKPRHRHTGTSARLEKTEGI